MWCMIPVASNVDEGSIAILKIGVLCDAWTLNYRLLSKILEVGELHISAVRVYCIYLTEILFVPLKPKCCKDKSHKQHQKKILETLQCNKN